MGWFIKSGVDQTYYPLQDIPAEKVVPNSLVAAESIYQDQPCMYSMGYVLAAPDPETNEFTVRLNANPGERWEMTLKVGMSEAASNQVQIY